MITKFGDLKVDFSDFMNVLEDMERDYSDRTVRKPMIDIVESPGSYNILVDVPGIPKEQIDVSITGKVLTIKGETKKETETKDTGYFICERSYGSFARNITLPDNVDLDKIGSTQKNGVLEITISKKEKEKPKKIKIN